MQSIKAVIFIKTGSNISVLLNGKQIGKYRAVLNISKKLKADTTMPVISQKGIKAVLLMFANQRADRNQSHKSVWISIM